MDSKITQNTNHAPWPLWLLVADAAVYAAALYYCVLLTFFFRDGAVGAGMRFAGLGMVLVVLMLGYATRMAVGGKWKQYLVMDALAFLFIAAWLPWKFSGVATAKGLSFAWAAIEWWKLPPNLALMFRAAPIGFILFWTAVLGLIELMRRNRRLPAAAIIIAFSIWYSIQLLGMEAGVRLPAYLFFVIALLAAMVAGVKGYMRICARVLIMDGAFLVIFLFYIGALPLYVPRTPGPDAGVQRIYPQQGARADFPLKFLRDMHVDNKSGFLFTAYGPTSGIVRVNLDSGKADIIHNPGIVRVMWTRPELDHVFALDWQYADFYKIKKDPFRILNKTDIHDDVLVTPMSYAIANGKLYVVSTDLPALTRFDLATLKKEARIDFRKLGLTAFRSGAWKCVIDEKEQKIFVEMGPVDLRGRYLMVRVDLATFTVEKTAHLPQGGLELVLTPWDNTLIAPSFFSETMYVIDRDTLQIKRTIRGPLTCRNLVVDKKRKLLYGTSYTRGKLSAIRYSDGETLRTIAVGRKPSSLAYAPERDALYAGSERGIFEINAKTFVMGNNQ